MRASETADILFVDDDENDAELIVHALRANNSSIKLLHLKNGLEALEFIFAEMGSPERSVLSQLKLVMLDLNLSNINGLEVLRKIRADPRTKSLPVVILSSSREKRDIVKAYDLGVNSYVVKPVGFEKFVRVISTLSSYWNEVNVRPPIAFEKTATL